MKRVTLPDGLESLGFYSFADTGLEDINFPSSLMKIDKCAFQNTPFFEKIENKKFVIFADRFLYLYNGYDDKVEVPDGVEIICSGAFTSRKPDDNYRFRTPKRIILPDSVKRIDEYAFKYVYGLREINLREDIDIAPTAFDQSGYETNYEAFLADKGEKK